MKNLAQNKLAAIVNNTNYSFVPVVLPSRPLDRNMFLGLEVGQYFISERDFYALQDIKNQADQSLFEIREINNGANGIFVTIVESTMNANDKKIAIAKICRSQDKVEPFQLTKDDLLHLFDVSA